LRPCAYNAGNHAVGNVAHLATNAVIAQFFVENESACRWVHVSSSASSDGSGVHGRVPTADHSVELTPIHIDRRVATVPRLPTRLRAASRGPVRQHHLERRAGAERRKLQTSDDAPALAGSAPGYRYDHVPEFLPRVSAHPDRAPCRCCTAAPAIRQRPESGRRAKQDREPECPMSGTCPQRRVEYAASSAVQPLDRTHRREDLTVTRRDRRRAARSERFV